VQTHNTGRNKAGKIRGELLVRSCYYYYFQFFRCRRFVPPCYVPEEDSPLPTPPPRFPFLLQPLVHPISSSSVVDACSCGCWGFDLCQDRTQLGSDLTIHTTIWGGEETCHKTGRGVTAVRSCTTRSMRHVEHHTCTSSLHLQYFTTYNVVSRLSKLVAVPSNCLFYLDPLGILDAILF
jgi:hypothetical protein